MCIRDRFMASDIWLIFILIEIMAKYIDVWYTELDMVHHYHRYTEVIEVCKEVGLSWFARRFLMGWHLHTPNTWFRMRVTLTCPPTLLMLKSLSLSFKTEDAVFVYVAWSGEVEWCSEVAETSTKWVGRWCSACYSSPAKPVLVFSMAQAYLGHWFWSDWCSIVPGHLYSVLD